VLVRTFHVDWEVDFYNFSVEAKDRLEVGLDDVARKIGNDDDLGIWLIFWLFVHVHVDIARLGRS
jgi:hypothetical protein